MKCFPSLVVALCLVACQASVSTKSNTSADTHSDTSSSTDTTSPAPPPAPSASATSTTTTTSAPAAECPFQCFVADGANRTPVSAEDQEKLRTALESTMGGVRACVGNMRRHHLSSPVLNVRVNSAGEMTDVGVDLHGYEAEQTCLESVAHQPPSGTFSGPADIRCFEKCERPARVTKAAKNAAKQ